MFLPHFRTNHAPRIDADLDFVLEQARILEQYQYLKPSFVSSLELGGFRPATGKPISNAQVKDFSRRADGSWNVAGIASHNGRPADLILISAEAPDRPATIVGIAETGQSMPFPLYHLDLFHIGCRVRERSLHLEWNGTLPPDTFSAASSAPAPLTIKFWVFDSVSTRAFPIKGRWLLDPAAQILASADPE